MPFHYTICKPYFLYCTNCQILQHYEMYEKPKIIFTACIANKVVRKLHAGSIKLLAWLVES